MLRRKLPEKRNEITWISYPQSKLISCRFAVSSQTIFERHGRHVAPARTIWMAPPMIRPARVDEYDEIARVWMDSWVSTGLEHASDSLLAKLRARIPLEVEKGWSLFVADDGGALAAMLALHLPKFYLDQLFVGPEYQGRDVGRRLLAFTRQHLPDEIWLRCVRENEKAWRWYEREGFVFEKEEVEPMIGFVMKYYRWKREGATR
jgi:GNAT superfamily N-acetyltransferase